MRSTVAAALAVAILTTGLTACSTIGHTSPTPTPTPTFATLIRTNGHSALVGNGVNGDQADLGGVLTENDAHCSTINGLVIVWPRGTRLLDDGSVVVLGKTLTFGSKVNIGGGVWPAELALPSGCAPGPHGYWNAGPSS